MRAVVQRVTRGRCTVADEVTGAIGAGLVVLVGVSASDSDGDAAWLARKVAGLRIFADDQGRMNRDIRDARGAALVIPQFTLYGDARHGRRPDFTRAAAPAEAQPMFESFCRVLAAEGVPVERGRFREHMQIELVNDGPVTLVIETPPPPGAGAGR
jgi:D-tyrosyl-tRNA(Tyr) deacylase